MLLRLLHDAGIWLREPVAGDRVVVVVPIRLHGHALAIDNGATGTVVWSLALAQPGMPCGRVLFDRPQSPLVGTGNELHVWPRKGKSGAVTWGSFGKMPRD